MMRAGSGVLARIKLNARPNPDRAQRRHVGRRSVREPVPDEPRGVHHAFRALLAALHPGARELALDGRAAGNDPGRFERARDTIWLFEGIS